MTSVHDATASMIGYLYQCRYALLAALDEVKSNPGHQLSIERFDDISFERDGSPHELIQTKHHADPGELSDMSVDVWKTLRIWIKRAIEDPQSVIRTRFIFMTTATAAENGAMEKLRLSSQNRDVPEAIKLLKAVAGQSTNQATKIARDAFLNLEPALREELVSKIWVFDNAPNIINVMEEIEDILVFAAPSGKVSVFAQYLEGWWLSRVITSLANDESSSIPLTALTQKIDEIRDEFRSENLPLDTAIAQMEAGQINATDNRTFMLQMRAVCLDDRQCSRGLNDYYRASAQRSRWAREDLLLDGEVERYDSELSDAWFREKSAQEDGVPDLDQAAKEQFGRTIFHWASRYQKPLRNRDEIWLSAGSYQMLSDRLEIGWHPDFASLFSKEEQES